MAKQHDTEQENESLAVNDAWTGMLVVSFLALSIGSAFLAWDWYQYSDKPPTPTNYSTTPPAAANPKPKEEGKPKEEAKPKEEPKQEKKEEPKADEKKKDEEKKDDEKKNDARLDQPSDVALGGAEKERFRCLYPSLQGAFSFQRSLTVAARFPCFITSLPHEPVCVFGCRCV